MHVIRVTPWCARRNGPVFPPAVPSFSSGTSTNFRFCTSGCTGFGTFVFSSACITRNHSAAPVRKQTPAGERQIRVSSSDWPRRALQRAEPLTAASVLPLGWAVHGTPELRQWWVAGARAAPANSPASRPWPAIVLASAQRQRVVPAAAATVLPQCAVSPPLLIAGAAPPCCCRVCAAPLRRRCPLPLLFAACACAGSHRMRLARLCARAPPVR